HGNELGNLEDLVLQLLLFQILFGLLTVLVPFFPSVFGPLALAGLSLEFLQGFPYLFLNLLLGGLHLGNGSSLAGPSTNPTFGRGSVASGLSSVLYDALSALPTVGAGIRGGSIRFLGILFLFLGLVELGQVDFVPGDLGPCKLLILCLDGLGLLLLGGFRRGRSGL